MAEEVMATLTIGYKTYCMPIDDAVAIIKGLSGAKIYDTKYRSSADGGSTHHIYDSDEKTQFQLGVISADLYRMAKLAGKPKE